MATATATSLQIIMRKLDDGRYAATVTEPLDPGNLTRYRLAYDTPAFETPEEAGAEATAFALWKGIEVHRWNWRF